MCEKIDELSNKMEQMTKEKDGSKLILKVPKGTRDRNPFQMKVLENVFGTIVGCFKRHDAVTLDTPVFELKEVLSGKYGEDSKLIYDLQDQGGELLSLRYDLTVPFARYVAMNKIKSMKRYQIGKVYRRDQPAMTRGRYREFYQCDFDIAGQFGPMLADVECLRIIYEILSELELGEFLIKVNHRCLLDGLFAACGVPADKFTATCSAVDKLDKVTWAEVENELLNEKGLSKVSVDAIGKYVQISGGVELIEQLECDSLLANQPSVQKALSELNLLLTYCASLGIANHVRLDMSLARGLDYYTGVIYEAVLTGFVHNSNTSISEAVSPANQEGDKRANRKKSGKGKSRATEAVEPLSVGSVAGGGRYDGLVGMFDSSGTCVPCVGVSFGIERLLAISEALVASGAKRNISSRPTETDVMVVSTQRGLDCQRLRCCRVLWDAKIKATFSHKSDPKLLQQFQYCESTGIPLAVIIGVEELGRNAVKIRNVETRQEREVPYDTLVDELLKELDLIKANSS